MHTPAPLFQTVLRAQAAEPPPFDGDGGIARRNYGDGGINGERRQRVAKAGGIDGDSGIVRRQ